jgi:hypothetical protein
MDNHGKKFIAPIIVVFGIVLYYFIGINVLLKFNVQKIIIVIVIILSIIITIILIMVLIERIKEIKQGEEDDLGKY